MAQMNRRMLTEAVDEALQKGVEFRPVPHYNRLGDSLSLYLSDQPAYSQRVDEILTVYRTIDGGELVGCKIKGVSHLAKNVASIFNILDDTMEIEIRLLLLNAAGVEPKEYYYDLGSRFAGIKMPLGELLRKAA
jgi:hypothetical protein